MSEKFLPWLAYSFSGCLGFMLGCLTYRLFNGSLKEIHRLKEKLSMLQNQLTTQELLVHDFYQKSNLLLQNFKQAYQNSFHLPASLSSYPKEPKASLHKESISFVSPTGSASNYAAHLDKQAISLTQTVSTKRNGAHPPADYPVNENWTNKLP